MRKIREELEKTKPYFNGIRNEIKRIFRTRNDIDNKFFYPMDKAEVYSGTYAYLIITADKGLCGAYNQNIIKKTLEELKKHDSNRVFIIGEYGRKYFDLHKIPYEKDFNYTASNPTFIRAKEIAEILLELYLKKDVTKIHIIYSDLKNAATEIVNVERLLPLHRKDFIERVKDEEIEFDFEPSIEKVLDNIIPSYVAGYIYSAMVDSFCCEQNSRMQAMDYANKNADKLIDDLRLKYNNLRQDAITQEITEVSSGFNSYKRKR